ncbi:MAG: TIGR02678 family protein [Steroidobacteraceae bacterium]
MSGEAGLADVLAHQTADERERALRALLMRPLLAEGDPDLALVRRHTEYLREWFGREAGWRLAVERSCARLYKRPAATNDGTRGLEGFTRERYALLCLACAALERSESQITLRRLGEQLLEAAADPELIERGFTFTLESPTERRALVQVCRFLVGCGALSRVVGDEETYIARAGDVLYDIHRRVLAALPASSRGASLIAATAADISASRDASSSGTPAEWTTPALSQSGFEGILSALVEEYVPDSVEGRRTALRHHLSRHLLDDPVIYHDELTEEARQYLATQRGPMAARLAEATGLVVELRAEGLALVDERGELTDRALPAVGTQAHVTLLTAEHLARAAREEPERLHSRHELAAFIRLAADRYGRYWRKEARAAGAEMELVERAIEHLEALRLILRVEGGVKVRPALLRFAIGEARSRRGGRDGSMETA